MNLMLALPAWRATWPALLEIVVLWIVLYLILRFLQGTRGAGLLRGLVFLLIMALVLIVVTVERLGLYRIEYILNRDVLPFLLLIAVLFQPEIRRLLLRLGEAPMLRWLFRPEASIVPEIVEAVFKLAQRKVGALITIERDVGLGGFLEAGTPLHALVTSELLGTIFWPGSPLHDGAVVIRGDRVAAAGCFFPLTEQPGIAKALGTRHRAAIGITEESDAVSIVVSEETQQVSVAHRGQLRMGLGREELRHFLEESLVETAPAAAAATER